MIDKLYDLTAQIGYLHPLHPALTHLPVGGVMVAFFLALAALLLKKNSLFTSAYHAATVAFVMLIPTALVGFLDWQHYYSGAWLFPIKMKMGLATLLFILLFITLLVGRKSEERRAVMMCLYFLCLMNVAGIGYFGGELVFGHHGAKTEQDFQEGQKIFTSNCSGCHVNGGNVINPSFPLKTSLKLQSYEIFIAFVRDPKLPDGTKGPMPDFTADKLSDQQAHELYNYIVNKLAKSK